MIAQIAAAAPAALAVGLLAWRYSPTRTRNRLIREARQIVAGLRDVRPRWTPADHPDIYRVVQLDQMECLACMGSGEERFRVACRLCDGRGFLDAFHDDPSMAERRR